MVGIFIPTRIIIYNKYMKDKYSHDYLFDADQMRNVSNRDLFTIEQIESISKIEEAEKEDGSINYWIQKNAVSQNT